MMAGGRARSAERPLEGNGARVAARRRLVRAVLAAALVAWPALVAQAGRGDGDKPAEKPEECVKVRPEARYTGYGYDHLVHIDNQCEVAKRCAVSTNVNPEVQRVVVAAGKSTTVATFRGSPARTFEPKVECEDAAK